MASTKFSKHKVKLASRLGKMAALAPPSTIRQFLRDDELAICDLKEDTLGRLTSFAGCWPTRKPRRTRSSRSWHSPPCLAIGRLGHHLARRP